MDLGQIGVAGALALAAVGSAVGAGSAGMAAIGAWKKCFVNNKQAPFMLVVFVGAPLTQTIYGMILMGALGRSEKEAMIKLAVGVLGGIAMGFSAWFQGKSGAVASDALAETGKGFGNFIIVLGLVETVALFVMVFAMGVL